MKLKIIFPAALAVLKAKLLSISTPLAVTWQLTSDCNLRCKYCGVWETPFSTLSVDQIEKILNELKAKGTIYLSLTGGEPLIRKDIDQILKLAIEKGFFVSLSTNGFLLKEKIHLLTDIKDIKLSYDGPEKVHDLLRGKGAYRDLINAIELCIQNNIKPSLQCVISKHNLDYQNEILALGKKYQIMIMFQPSTETMLWSNNSNLTTPDIEKYKEFIRTLMRKKREGEYIRNSLSGLKHMLCWPNNTKIYCSAGLLTYDILPNGQRISCFRYEDITLKNKSSKNKPKDIKLAFDDVQKSPSCQQCWCGGLVEFNLITSFNISAISNWLTKY